MRTLFLSPNVPYPPNSGSHQRIYHFLRALSRVSDVALVAFVERDEEHGHLDTLRQWCGEVHAISRNGRLRSSGTSRPRIWLESLLEACHPTMPAVFRWYQSVEGSALVANLCARPIDILLVAKLPLLSLVPSSPRMQVFVDLHDVESSRLAHRIRNVSSYHRLPLDYLELYKLARVERRLSRLPYHFSVCSTLDRAALGSDVRASVIPNGVDLPSEALRRRPQSPRPTLLFVGTMNYEPNVDAVRLFATRILPHVRARCPGVRFVILGRDPSPVVRGLHDGDGVLVTDAVPSVEPYLWQASAAVVPIRFGGGTRIKILEAMAHHVPVVSTSVGAEGLELEPDKHFLLADSPAAFADACVRVLQDEQLRLHLTREAFDIVKARYQWSQVEQSIIDMVTRLVPSPDTRQATVRYAWGAR